MTKALERGRMERLDLGGNMTPLEITANTILDLPAASPSARICDCGCSRRFVPPPFAPHKRFATADCRNRWHLQRRKEALAKLEELEAAQSEQRKRT